MESQPPMQTSDTDTIQMTPAIATIPSTMGTNNSPLLKLPAELRNEIHAYLLPAAPREWFSSEASKSSARALIQVSRSMRNEFLPLYYSIQVISLEGIFRAFGKELYLRPDSSSAALTILEPRAVASLRRFSFTMPSNRDCVSCRHIVHLDLGRKERWTVFVFGAIPYRHWCLMQRPAETQVDGLVESVFMEGDEVVVSLERIESFIKGFGSLPGAIGSRH